ncbi:MAG: hypothetical protein J6Q67_04410 [Clostridia bacterium]|nr:hypothetical protein [Clostridia bacterium]
MKKLLGFFPLSRATEGKQVFIRFLIYLVINFAVGLIDKFLDLLKLGSIGGVFALIANIYVYVGIFLLAYNFIVNTKR